MDLSDIVMLEAIVKCGSISKASEVLHVTQPTLSKRLSRLEYTLGTSLFDRSSSGLTPTAHTVFIIDSAQEIKNKIGNIERHIELMNMLEAGNLRIGVGPIVEQLYFPHVLLALTRSSNSRLNLSIRTEMSSDLVGLLQEGSIDIAVGPFEETSIGDSCKVVPLASQPLMVALRKGHPLLENADKAQTPALEDVARYTMISPHTPDYMLEQYPELSEIDGSQARVIFDNYSVIKAVLQASDHISIGPGAVFSKEVLSGELILLPMPQPVTWHAACLTRPENASLPVIQRVLETFRSLELPRIDI